MAVAVVGAMATAKSASPKPIELPELLFRSSVARVSLRRRASPLPSQLSIEALENSLQVDAVTIDGVLSATTALLDEGRPFRTTWDLRHCAVPNAITVFRVSRWALMEKRRLDRCNVRLAVVLPPTRVTLFAVVDAVLRAFGPRCPALVTGDPDAASRFMEAADADDADDADDA